MSPSLESPHGGRQRVAAQIADANINAVLVAPQLAINANDSSAGRFWETYGFAQFIGEAGAHLARLHGDPRTRKTFATNTPMPQKTAWMRWPLPQW